MRALQHIRIAGLALIAAFAVAASASAQTFPALTGRVVDEAGILDQATRAALVTRLAALETKTTDQLVVATVKSLQGLSIEVYANRLFAQWRLGRKDKNNGVLLVVAPTDRKVRIEVGYGLEGTLSDVVAKHVIDESILPRFRTGDMAGGVVRGVGDILRVLAGDAEDSKQRAAPPVSKSLMHVPALGAVALSPAWQFMALALIYLATAFMICLAVYLAVVQIVRCLAWMRMFPRIALPNKTDR